MLDLRKLRTFRMVASANSFTRAAVELGCSQPNVTAQIKALERELGAPLFERYRFTKKVVLTELGRRAFEYSGRLLALADEIRSALRKDSDPSASLKGL